MILVGGQSLQKRIPARADTNHRANKGKSPRFWSLSDRSRLGGLHAVSVTALVKNSLERLPAGKQT